MFTRAPALSLALAILWLMASTANVAASRGKGAAPAMVRLPGHVLSALAKATKVAPHAGVSNQPATLTIVLKRDDQKGFDRYLKDIKSTSSCLWNCICANDWHIFPLL
jgi:hypothetical protein